MAFKRKRYPSPLSETDERIARVKILGTVEYLDAKSIPYYKADVFSHFGVNRARGWKILKEGPNPPQQRNLPDHVKDPRGRKPLLTREHLVAMERVVLGQRASEALLSWDELGKRAGVEKVAHSHTIKNHMQDLEYHRCSNRACGSGWVVPRLAVRRESWARGALAARRRRDDWYGVRFGDEVHISRTASGALRLLPPPGTRPCTACLAAVAGRGEPAAATFHVWASVGHGHKSALHFYEGTNQTGSKLNQETYMAILEAKVKSDMAACPWLVLAEDGDHAHTGHRCTKYKKDNNIRVFEWCAKSPDLSVVRGAWESVEEMLGRLVCEDDEAAKRAIEDMWASVRQEIVDRFVEGMPERLYEVICNQGKLGGQRDIEMHEELRNGLDAELQPSSQLGLQPEMDAGLQPEVQAELQTESQAESQAE